MRGALQAPPQPMPARSNRHTLSLFYAFNTLFRDDRNHDQGGSRVCPPPSQNRIEKQTSQQEGRQIDTEIGLFGVRVHRRTPELLAYIFLGTRKDRHDD